MNFKVNDSESPTVVMLTSFYFRSFDRECVYQIFAKLNHHLIEVDISNEGGIHRAVTLLSVLTNIDFLILPGIISNEISLNQKFSSSLLELSNRKVNIISIGSGSIILAQSGVLNSKIIACDIDLSTHLTLLVPSLRTESNKLFVKDDNLFSCHSDLSIFDLFKSIIDSTDSLSSKTNLASSLSIPTRANIRQNSRELTIKDTTKTRMYKVINWAEHNLDSINSVDDLANKTICSRRSFDRKFKEIMGVSPNKWLIKKRISLAKEILQTQNVSIDIIAQLTGFEATENLRNNFIKQEGVSPALYRKKAIIFN